MDKKGRYALYAGSVCPGWWGILDKYIPQILAIAPDADPYIKEKFGLLRVRALGTVADRSALFEIQNAAEEASSTVCEYCGAPGKLRTDWEWMLTLCDCCNCANSNTIEKIIQETENKWLAED